MELDTNQVPPPSTHHGYGLNFTGMYSEHRRIPQFYGGVTDPQLIIFFTVPSIVALLFVVAVALPQPSFVGCLIFGAGLWYALAILAVVEPKLSLVPASMLAIVLGLPNQALFFGAPFAVLAAFVISYRLSRWVEKASPDGVMHEQFLRDWNRQRRNPKHVVNGVPYHDNPGRYSAVLSYVTRRR